MFTYNYIEHTFLLEGTIALLAQQKPDRQREINQYLHDLEQVLRTRDLHQFKQFVLQHQYLYPQEMIVAVLRNDPIVEIGMHKIICMHPDLKDLRQDLVARLQSRGYHDPLDLIRE